MKKNMGTADRSIRILAAVVIFALIYTETLQGTLAWILGALSVIFIFTSFVSWCPIYTLIGMSTAKKEA
jgi:hypothetical protein